MVYLIIRSSPIKVMRFDGDEAELDGLVWRLDKAGKLLGKWVDFRPADEVYKFLADTYGEIEAC